MAKIPVSGIEMHAEIRRHNKPGRVEFLFDRGRALFLDREEDIGWLLLAPDTLMRREVAFGLDHGSFDSLEGEVIVRDGARYRIIVDPNLIGMKDRDGCRVDGFWLKHETWPSLVPLKPSEFAVKALDD